MGMMIDEAIKDIELTCKYLKNIGVFDNPANEKCKPSLDMAKDIMHKYQKIQKIMAKRPKDMISSNPTLRAISGVLEDGKID